MDSLMKVKHNSKRLVASQGVGNLFCALTGSMYGTAATMRSVAAVKIGAKTRWSAILCSVIMAVLLFGRRAYKQRCRTASNNMTAAAAETPSPRELDVLRAMAKGYSTVEISHLLFISENTVETHRKNLMQKFGARNATDLVLRALAKGYLTLPIE